MKRKRTHRKADHRRAEGSRSGSEDRRPQERHGFRKRQKPTHWPRRFGYQLQILPRRGGRDDQSYKGAAAHQEEDLAV
jgi:hypothetical protein